MMISSQITIIVAVIAILVILNGVVLFRIKRHLDNHRKSLSFLTGELKDTQETLQQIQHEVMDLNKD